MTTKKEATRLRLLEAGLEMAMNNGALPHIDVRLTEVLGQVGLTTGAAYNIWGSQDEFRTDLAIEVAGKFKERKLNDCRGPVPARSMTLANYVSELAQAIVANNTDDMAFLLPLRFCGVSSVPEPITERIAEGYKCSDAVFEAIISDICERFDLEIAEGETLEEVALMAVASTDGVLMRNRLANDSASTKKNGAVLAGLFRSILNTTLVPANGSASHSAANNGTHGAKSTLAASASS